jgi:hypothetical protein
MLRRVISVCSALALVGAFVAVAETSAAAAAAPSPVRITTPSVISTKGAAAVIVTPTYVLAPGWQALSATIVIQTGSRLTVPVPRIALHPGLYAETTAVDVRLRTAHSAVRQVLPTAAVQIAPFAGVPYTARILFLNSNDDPQYAAAACHVTSISDVASFSPGTESGVMTGSCINPWHNSIDPTVSDFEQWGVHDPYYSLGEFTFGPVTTYTYGTPRVISQRHLLTVTN